MRNVAAERPGGVALLASRRPVPGPARREVPATSRVGAGRRHGDAPLASPYERYGGLLVGDEQHPPGSPGVPGAASARGPGQCRLGWRFHGPVMASMMPGFWMLANSVRPSGENVTPAISL